LTLPQKQIDFSKHPTEKLAFSFFESYIGVQFPNYRYSPHNFLISKKLQQLESGKIRRLMIVMPPRHGKTMQVSEFFPAWYLGRNPTHQVIAATYSYDRAGDVGRKVRNQMIDPVHKFIFPDCTISPDSKGANKLATEQDGHYYSVGVGGAIVGRGANLFIIDDPIKSREDAESITSRRKINEWFRAVAYTRLMPDNRVVIVMTRWHFDDLAGWLLDEGKEKWDVLSLPAVAESDCIATKRKTGDALWETDYPKETLKQIKTSIGSREWNAQYQQRPLDEEGGMIKLGWFKRYDEREIIKYDIACSANSPPIEKPFGIHRIVLSWDTAFKESELNDPSSCTVWGISNMGYYLLYVLNKRMEFPQLKRHAIKIWNRYMKYEMGAVGVLVEDRASGQSLIQVLNNETSMPIIPIRPDANKVIRMGEVSPIIEAGHVHLPENAPWLVRYETQIAQFPLGKEDDDVDSTTQFLRWVTKPRYKRSKLRWRVWK
jgi:predicted phage terminase large subunit-like protein